MRYMLLLVLNIPVITLAVVTMITQYKLHKVSAARLRHQLIIWLTMFVVLVGSFPVYNLLTDKPVFNSDELSLFDIFQTSAIVMLFYIVNHQRQRIERSEKTMRTLHEEISIRLSGL